MLNNQKKLALTLLAGTSYLLSLTGMMQALPQAQAQTPAPQVPSSPLSPNDPAAKLDPALLKVPALQAPKSVSSNSTNSNAPVQTISYDLKTGKTQLSASLPTTTAATSSSVSAPSMGLSPTVAAEPRAGVQSLTGGVKPNSVIGADNRTKITATTTYPWRTVTKLYVTFPNGGGGCTGTLIAAKYVLTAGHCVYDKAAGGWAKKIEVIPGLKGTYKPYGSAFGTKFRSYTGWTSSQKSDYDIALITLDRSIGTTTGWLGYAYYSSINGVTGNIAGYPGDKDNGLYLYYHYGPIASSTSYRLSYQIDTAAGQSGSGIYRINNNQRYVFGVHTNGTSSPTGYNSGTRIDSKKFNDLKSWIASGQ